MTHDHEHHHRGHGRPEGRGDDRQGDARRRPSFGEAVGPGLVPDLGGRRRGGPRGGRGRGGPWHGRRGRPRGDVRAALLLLLAEQPRHGYELIQEIADRSAGAWRPSPGSVYPTLQVLEDEGLVVIESVDGRKTASLTEAGRAFVEENRAGLGTPWETGGHGPELAARQSFMALVDAAKQVARVGTPAQLQAAGGVLDAARKDLYRILAEPDETT